MNLADHFVRKFIIRGDDPRDPAASRNGVKMRAYLTVIGALALAVPVLYALPLSTGQRLVGLVITGYGTVGYVTDPINDACEEWNEREESDDGGDE